MKKETGYPKVVIRQRPEHANSGKIMSGASTEVLIDGKKLNGCYKAEFIVEARDVAKLVLHMYSDDVTIEGRPEIGKVS